MYRKSLLVLVLLSLCLMLAMFANFKTVYAKQPADSIWVEPVIMDVEEASVGSKFNVTVWLSVTSHNMYTWQFKLYYDTSQLTALRAGYTGPDGECSEWATHRTGGDTTPVTPVIEDDYVLLMESCMENYYVPNGTSASLAWVEFQIKAVPPAGGVLKSLFDVNNEDTYVLDTDLEEIPVFKHTASYTLIPEFTLPIYIAVFAIASTAAFALRKKFKT
jgi:hypothetical protein